MIYKSYNIIEGTNYIKVEGVMDFSPEHTFDCGQCFRWTKEADGSYTGIVGKRIGNITYENETLEIKNASIDDFVDTWYDYLDLGTDYSKIKKILSRDEIMAKAVESGKGIRVLKQDIWETLISFILSTNKRIPMIMKAVESISCMYGEDLIYNDKRYYSFPSIESLYSANLEQLVICKGGYRCKYILDTARLVAEHKVNLEELVRLDTENARKLLVTLPGVGDKVADCTLLFSGTKMDVFPTDVWVKRVMEELYLKHDASFKEIQDFARQNFGEHAGIAQEYLFYYARENRIGAK